MKQEVLNKLTELIQKRDEELMKRFCTTGAYTDELGNEIFGVCKTVSTQEILNFMHVHDAQLIEAISKSIK